ncbi:MAG TPA: prolipoprotein diacylglyceryl transferase [Thermoanaerobaculia bacterium]|jgi:phosphatidylglycerol:prolipoprotein diacylglycerol transferase|nr:prolipoprotein diacylglyceryl transferase [Thermoanaerobaculia bacterium]
MIQELFHIGSFSVSPFGLMLVCAFLASYVQLRWGMRWFAAGDEEDASALVFAAGLGGIVGAKVYYALLNRDWHVLLDRSGLVWYGGFVVGAAAVLLVIRRRRLPVWPLIDASAPALALGYAVGRIGCFLVGDDYGRPSDLPWAVAFPVGLPRTTAGDLRQVFHLNIPSSVPDDALLRVHPTQLYETAICLLIWGAALWLMRRRPYPAWAPGVLGLTVLCLLALERFLVEFLRAKDDRFLGDFTLAQAISVLVLLVAAALARTRWRQWQQLRATEQPQPSTAAL